MIAVFLIKCLGFFAYCLPDCIRRAICVVLGWGFWFGPFDRRRRILANLKRCFPEKPPRWRSKIGRESCCRLIEMGMFVLVSPFLTKKQIRARFVLDNELLALMQDVLKNPKPLVILGPHFTLMEGAAFFPALTDEKLPETGVLYRPLDYKPLDKWVKQTRERHGVKLVDRKGQMMDAIHNLNKGGALTILYDQNAGAPGAQTLFFGRAASTTQMPGMFVERFKARVGVLYAQRTRFFRATIKGEAFLIEPTRQAVMLESTRWLERKLSTDDDNITADWLWAHNRWGRRRAYECMFNVRPPNSMLDVFFKADNIQDIPDKDRYWITLPKDKKRLEALLPVLQQHKRHRPDIRITALCESDALETVKAANIADDVVSRTGRPLSFFLKIRNTYPEVHLVFEESLRANVEAFLMGAFLRVGFKSRGSFLLTDRIRPPKGDYAARYRAFAKACHMRFE